MCVCVYPYINFKCRMSSLFIFFMNKIEVFLSKQPILLSRDDRSKKLYDNWGLSSVKHVLCMYVAWAPSFSLKSDNFMCPSEL